MSLQKLFQKKYADKIQSGLPKLFSIAELENKRGNKIAMEIGSTRERIIIALLYHAYGIEKIQLPIFSYLYSPPLKLTFTSTSFQFQLKP